MVVTQAEVNEAAEWLQIMAATAKLMEMTAGQPQLGVEQIDSYKAQFKWPLSKFAEFNTPASYEFAGLTEGFRQIAVEDFEASDSDNDGVPDTLASDHFRELDQLSRIIDESHGVAFDTFADNVLLKMDTMYQNQGLIAQTLGLTAELACNIYIGGRADLLRLSNKALQRLEWICARERGDGANFENEGTVLSVGSLAIGLLGLVPGLGTAATLVSAVVSIASLAADNEVLKEPSATVTSEDGTEYHITGETTEDVMSSLWSAIQKLIGEMKEAESNLTQLIESFSTMLQDKEERANVVAPAVDYPQNA